jgi:D-lactate dehydrogenase (cytochrome)
MVGSEGTLGVITEITLKLYPLPEAIMAATCAFDSLADAVNTTIQIIQLGIPIARCELLDGNTVRMVNQHSKLGLAEEPMMLMEFHGSPAGVQEQITAVQEIVADNRGHGFQWAQTPEERTRLWTARHNAYFAGVQSRPGCRCITTDTCVPISRLADALLDSVHEATEAGIPYFMVGHVGDGNFHMGYLIDPASATERETAERLNSQLVARALRLGGTCTGEHGIGLHKMDFLIAEAGAGAVAMMRSIKQALDPLNILNPGKIFALEP